MFTRTVLFLLINFAALALGGLFTGKGVPSEWYAQLNKAPWTPPGWVFGFAWTTIMICFSFYMASLWPLAKENKWIPIVFALQWVLNTGWNPLFFYFHYTTIALVVIFLLTVLVAYLLFHFWPELQWKTLLIVPYFVWLLIATSLNGYICLRN